MRSTIVTLQVIPSPSKGSFMISIQFDREVPQHPEAGEWVGALLVTDSADSMKP